MYRVYTLYIQCMLVFNSKLSSFRLTSGTAEPFLSGTSSVYIEQMYETWRQDPHSVHKV